jgi:DNA modification methylase
MTRPDEIRSTALPQPEMRKVANIWPAPRNARTHSTKQLRQIATSIRTFGFTNPVLIDGKGQIIAGHGRLAAAQLLGLEQVPTLCIDWLNDAEQRAYVIADNRLAERAGWDRDLLAIELGALCDLEIDETLTGFELGEIELVLDAGAAGALNESPVAVGSGPGVCQPDDLWQLGRHRLLCGDALDHASYCRLMGRDRARLVVTDPPYNVPIGGHVSGLGKVRHREFVQGAGEMSDREFLQFLTSSLSAMAKVSREGSLHYVFMDWRHLPELIAAGRAVHDDWLNLCVWAKSNAGMGSLYRSQHELVTVFRRGRRPHVNNVALGSNGRHRSNVWNYAGVNSFSAERDEALGWHPTVKPLEMIVDIIKDASDRDEIVLDGFGGSGTTLIAAEQCARTARLLELDPLYCDVILRRFSASSGQMPVLTQSGETFAAVEQRIKREADRD